MINLKTVLVIIALLGGTTIFAQTTPEAEEKPFIEVTGTAEQEVVPDEIYIKITIREKYVNKEKITIEVQEEKLKAALREIGIDLKNLSLSDANADYVKVKWGTKDVLTKKDFTLKVGDAVTLGKAFQQLDKLEITDAFISKVSHSKIDSLRKEVRIMAIKAAKAKTDYLLMAIGEQTGKPMVVRELELENLPLSSNIINVGGSRASMQGYYIDGIEMKDDEEEIQFQKIKLQAAIYVKFLIK